MALSWWKTCLSGVNLSGSKNWEACLPGLGVLGVAGINVITGFSSLGVTGPNWKTGFSTFGGRGVPDSNLKTCLSGLGVPGPNWKACLLSGLSWSSLGVAGPNWNTCLSGLGVLGVACPHFKAFLYGPGVFGPSDPWVKTSLSSLGVPGVSGPNLKTRPSVLGVWCPLVSCMAFAFSSATHLHAFSKTSRAVLITSYLYILGRLYFLSTMRCFISDVKVFKLLVCCLESRTQSLTLSWVKNVQNSTVVRWRFLASVAVSSL